MLKDVLKSKSNVDVVKLHKSGGVVPRNPKVRQKARSYKMRVNSIMFLETIISFAVYIYN